MIAKYQKPNRIELFQSSNELIKNRERLMRHLTTNEFKITPKPKLKTKETNDNYDHRSYKSKSVSTKLSDSFKSIKRNKIYSCMCIKLNGFFTSNSIMKYCLNSLVGFPLYIYAVLVFLSVACVATIVTLSVLNSRSNLPNRSYFANCTLNSDCDNLKALQCSAQNGICNCPVLKTKGHCDCNKGYYWSGYECLLLKQYLNYGCSANYMCDQSKFLLCLNKTCMCDPLKIFDSVSQTCKYTYLGCFYDSVYWVNSHMSGINNQFYLPDICINFCKLKGFNYTLMYKWGSQLCYCVHTFNFSQPITLCELICLGKNGEQYTCGSSTAWQYRSVYLSIGS